MKGLKTKSWEFRKRFTKLKSCLVCEEYGNIPQAEKRERKRAIKTHKLFKSAYVHKYTVSGEAEHSGCNFEDV